MSENKEEAKKNKKINKMTLEELKAKIEETKKNQGGLNSRYGKELQKQLDVLQAEK